MTTPSPLFASAEVIPLLPLTFAGYDPPQPPICKSGGCGDIYKATQIAVGRPACIKSLGTGTRSTFRRLLLTSHQTAAQSALAEEGDQFSQEVEIMVSLSGSPYVPVVYDRGRTPLMVEGDGGPLPLDDGWPYFVMEWVAGEQLGDFLTSAGGPWCANERRTNDGPTQFRELPRDRQSLLLKIFTEVARGLRDAHVAKIVHLDVSHRNLLVDYELENGVLQVKIIDWGTARRLNPEGTCIAGGVPGKISVEYAAPEQVKAGGAGAGVQAQDVGCRADVYALGGIGYYLLTGRQPRSSKVKDKAEACQDMKRQALSRDHHEALYQGLRKSGAPRFWRKLITKCLAESRQNRFATALEVADAIDDYYARLERRKRLAERFAASAFAVMAIFMAVIAWQWGADNRREKEFAQEKADSEAEKRAQAELASNVVELQQALTAAYGYWYKGDRKIAKKKAEAALQKIEALAEAHPDDLHPTLLRGYAHSTVGEMAAPDDGRDTSALVKAVFNRLPGKENRQRLEGALHHYQQAAEIYKGLEERWPDFKDRLANPEDAHELHVKSEAVQAFILAQLGRFSEAIIACDTAIRLDKNGKQTDNLPGFRSTIIPWAVREQGPGPWSRPPHPDHAKATRLASYLIERCKGVPEVAVYNAACAYALAAGDAPEQEKDRLARQAVLYLERIEKGYLRSQANRERLQGDKDLVSLQGRADYEALWRRVRDKDRN